MNRSRVTRPRPLVGPLDSRDKHVMRFLALAAILTQMLSPTAGSTTVRNVAQSTTPATAAEVTVKADRGKAVNDFIHAIGYTVAGGQLATWKDPVCASVTGLSSPEHAYYSSRLTDIAKQIGALTGSTSCQPNVFIYFTNHPNELVKVLFQEKPSFFDQMLPSRAEMDRPVYWRHGVEAAPADGSGGTVQCLDDKCFLLIQHARDSRLLSNVVYHLNLCIVIVDAKKMVGLTNAAISSYVGMIALAQIAPDASIGDAPSILTAFADRDAHKPLREDVTAWDLAYLKGLYASSGDVRASMQQEAIYNHFRKELSAKLSH